MLIALRHCMSGRPAFIRWPSTASDPRRIDRGLVKHSANCKLNATPALNRSRRTETQVSIELPPLQAALHVGRQPAYWQLVPSRSLCPCIAARRCCIAVHAVPPKSAQHARALRADRCWAQACCQREPAQSFAAVRFCRSSTASTASGAQRATQRRQQGL